MKDAGGLTPGILQPLPVVDAHLDLGMYLAQERRKNRRRVMESDFIDDIRKGGVKVIVAAIFVEPESPEGTPFEQACRQIEALYEEQEESPELFRLCTGAAEINACIDRGIPAVLMSMEGAEPLGDDPQMLDFFYRLGVRGLGLAHARTNLACDGARYTEDPAKTGTGLTELGMELIRRADALHMLLDVSHLNDPGTADVLALTKSPVIASHSNCRALNPTRRNLSDEQIRALAATGGVIGVNGCSAIVSDQIGGATLEALAGHIEHLVNVAGIDHVGLGFDMAEMILPDSYIVVNGNRQAVFDVIPGYAHLCELTGLLAERGFTGEMLEKIYARNFLRVYREVLTETGDGRL